MDNSFSRKKAIKAVLAVTYVFLLFFLFCSCKNARLQYSGNISCFTQSDISIEESKKINISQITNINNKTNTSKDNISQKLIESKKTNNSKVSEESKQPKEIKGVDESQETEESLPSLEIIEKDGSKVLEENAVSEKNKNQEESKDYLGTEDSMRGIWVSQYDMYQVYLDGDVQRSKSSYTSLVSTIIRNIKNDGFNTAFLQMRPFGDSFYKSNFYPLSRFVTGVYGRSISYDPIEIFIQKANESGVSVHGWINPMRLMKTDEITKIDNKYLIKQWFDAKSDKVVEVNGRLYLNPAYEEVRQLICSGAAEILIKYNVDGIHIDDYFYPTTEPSFDQKSYFKSGYASLQAFRENNINYMVRELYKTVHRADAKAFFGISPAGNLATLRSKYFVDIKKWCGEEGYTDYILPQIYFGFLHGSCPFQKMVDKWAALVTNPKINFYIGLSGGNAYNAYHGNICVWGVTEAGKNEWINNKDVLKRSFEYIFSKKEVDGFCFFCYQYLFNTVTGKETAELEQEKANFIEIVKQ